MKQTSIIAALLMSAMGAAHADEFAVGVQIPLTDYPQARRRL